MQKLRFAIIGTGFWANYQIPAWMELDGVELIALYNRTRSKAETIATNFGNLRVYDSVEELLSNEQLDFVDIITDVNTHFKFTCLAAESGVNIVCQKPMASSLLDAKAMVQKCESENVSLFIHENFRWQAPIRALKKVINSGILGKPFKAKVSFCSAFPVFENQPFLSELDHFILTDIGSHVLDICRYLFGEAKSLYSLTKRVNQKIKGEDVANVMMEMNNGLQCFAEMSYASLLEKEAFPQTLVLVEGSEGSVSLTHDSELKITTRHGTKSSIITPANYNWVDPDYAVVHSSIVDCNKDILSGLMGGKSEMTAEDNLRTVELVWASYKSAASGQAIHF